MLQYRWVGQVSDAERDRMRRNLRTAAIQFRDAFDGEIARAVFGLRVAAGTLRSGDWERYSDRYATWRETAAAPEIVKAVYLVDADAGALRLRRWNSTRHALEPAAWEGAVARWHPYFDAQHAAFVANERPGRGGAPENDDAVIVTPLLTPPPAPARAATAPAPIFGFTVLELDLEYIRGQLLAALAERHFNDAQGNRYRVAVATRGPSPTTLYQSDPDAPVDAQNADAREPIHSAFVDPQRLLFRRQGADRRGDRRRGNVVVEVFTAPDGGPETIRRVVNSDAGRWMLLVQHERGSLEAAVAAVRRRNLAVSFGTLLLLTLSVGLFTVSSRREQRLARQQMEFVAGVSHELRTPVAVIRSAAQNLAHGVVPAGDRVRRYGEVIEDEARRLGDMVERVLQYAGLESGLGVNGRVPLAPVDIVESALAASAPELANAEVRRLFAPDVPAVAGDAAALRAAVQNLVVNAVKHGLPADAGSHPVTVAVSATAAPRAEVHITVEDRGPGIPAAELPHIFEPFYRGTDAVARQIHGSGLGLSLVKRIVAAHGGRVSVVSRPGATAFTIALPAQS
jgi:signal transduction histidine kinase